MNGESDGDDEANLSRRTFMRASGAAAAAGLVGAGAVGTAAADELESVFRNIRVREARKAWERGYRGRADRTLALTDSGAEGRHPDLGPWNGVTATTTSDDTLKLERNAGTEEQELPVYREEVRQTEEYSGASAGGGVVGLIQTFGPVSIDPGPFDTTDDSLVQLRGTIDWEPGTPEGTEEPGECELRIVKNGTQVATTGGGLEVNTESRKTVLTNEPIVLNAEDDYEFEVVTWRSVNAYDVTIEFEELVDTGETETREVTVTEDVSVDSGTLLPDAGDTPELVAWHNDDTRYGSYDAPRDANGHGTHVSGIMTGSGQAATIDEVTTDSPRTVLVAGDVLEYEVDAGADGGVFGAAVGEGIEVTVEGPNGRQLARSVGAFGTSEVSVEANITQTPAVHESGSAAYTVYVRATEGEFAATGRVKEVAAGSFAAFDATDGEAVDDGDTAVHAGIAPGNSLVAVTGLGGGANNLARAADEFAAAFNLRAVNMSWGAIGGIPFGILGGALDSTPGDIADITDGGILTVAAAGNSATPANGNASPAVVEEAISVVATGPRDGIASYSSGGLGGLNEEGQPHAKPDVTAPGGHVNQLDWAAKAGDADSDAAYGDVRDFTGKGGTSMASPSVCGTAGLVAQAMEEDAPEALSLPEPVDTARDDVMQLKSVLLATASTTAFTAAPYHRAHAPTYTHGERDPYEGYGRVNVDAAIDAVTRPLLEAGDTPDDESASATFDETVGLDVPDDSRAVAGYVEARGGTLNVDLEFSHYGGGNSGMTKNVPHLDLFVYDVEPAANGEPSILASAQGDDGVASLSVDFETAAAGEDPDERTCIVVAELVNAPGAVNGNDVQAHFDLDVEFTAGKIPDVTTEFTASGSRNDDASVFTAGQTDRVRVTVENFENASEVTITDQVPDGWTVDERYGDVESFDPDSGTVTFQGTVSADQVGDNGNVTLTYFAEAPEGADGTGTYTFGPAEAEVVEADVPGEDSDGELDGDETDEFGGTDTNTVGGADTEA